jgi:HEAT repeat protein
MLTKLRDGKGSDFTDALARAAHKLTGEGQKEARAALAQRLTRMKAVTLRTMLQDDDAEIRRAAAYACAMKDDRTHVPDLIPLLNDGDPIVCLAGRTALKNLTRQDFGPEADAKPGDKARAILAWKDWWNKNSR